MSSSPDAVELPDPEVFWSASTMTKEVLLQMVQDEVLPAQDIIGWREAAGESFPTPNTDEIVVFESFFHHGFALPTCGFFRGLLSFYGSS